MTIARNGDGSISGSGSTSANVGGDTATVGVSITGRGVGGQTVFDLGLDMSVQKKDGSTSSFGITMGDFNSSTADRCPSVDGIIRLDDTINGAVRQGDVVKVGGANLGTFRMAGTLTGKVTSTARMSPDATLTPFRFAITRKLDVAISLKGPRQWRSGRRTGSAPS